MLPLSVKKIDKQEMKQRYERIVEALNISDISDKYPTELSGGQIQERQPLERLLLTHQ